MQKWGSILGYSIIAALYSVALGCLVLYLPIDIAISFAIVIAAVLALIGFGLTVVSHVKRPGQSPRDRTSRSQLGKGKSK